MPAIAFVTCDAFPFLTVDDRLAFPFLTGAGHEVTAVIWDDPAVPWDAFDAIVVRSCWDYHQKEAAFRAWIEARAAHPRVWNRPATLRWNLDKRYLLGLPHLPETEVVPVGDDRSLAAIVTALGVDEAVVKPIVSMNGWDTFRVGRDPTAEQEAAFRALVAHRDLFVQRYLPEIQAGELSFVFFGGDFSHGLRKRPARGEFRIQEDWGGTREAFAPTPLQIERAGELLDAVPGGADLLYARVDVVEAGDALVPIEVEVIDPALFFELDPTSPQRFAAALDRFLLRTG